MDIQDCLRELLEDDNTENGVQSNYFDLVASKSQESLLCFDGVKILPPLLSDVERDKMRELRCKAIDVEKKLFEAKREKYSNLMVQVMGIMDRIKRKVPENGEKAHEKGNSEKQQLKSEKKKCEITERREITPEVNKETRDRYVESFPTNSTNWQNHDKDEKFSVQKDNNDELKDSLVTTSIFQKPKLHNYSSSPRRKKDNIIIDVNKQRELTPSQLGDMCELSSNQQHLLLSQESTSSTNTLIGDGENYQGEFVERGREVNYTSDSLASTVLSMAFTDSSFASQKSNTEATQQTSKSVQRQLNMDVGNHDLYQSYYHKVSPITSTPTELQRPRTSSTRQKAAKKPLKASTVTTARSRLTDTDQDRALEKLEMMKKKLVQEKEKQIALLRQQELSRLRKMKVSPRKHDLSEQTEVVNTEMYSQGLFAPRPGSDMYSIPEQSFEGSMSVQGDTQHEAESASDKENNLMDKNNSQQRQYQDYSRQVEHYGGQTHGHRDRVWENYADANDSRPLTVRSTSSSRNESSSPFIRLEFRKQFEILVNQGSDGRDSFSLLTAYAKGFITRRLLQAEKVQSIVKTIKDTRDFLEDISKEGTSSHQDKSLQQRVQAQLVAAKTKLHDIFFKIPVQERMAYMIHSRNLAREREERKYAKTTTASQKSARRLSSATVKAMQRRKGDQNEQPEFKERSSRSPLVKKRTRDIRVLKPVQSSKSPQLPDKGRSSIKRRPATAPSPKRSSIVRKGIHNSRPATAMATRPGRRSLPRGSTEIDKPPLRRPPRASLDGKDQTTKRANIISDTEKAYSKLPVRSSIDGGGMTYRVPKADDNDRDALPTCRPLRPSIGRARKPAPVEQTSNNRPKTAVGVRRVTRSMAAKFSKP